jgi:hypothetical protein
MNSDPPRRYPMFCPWCLAEGKRVQTGQSTIPHTSAICRHHLEEVFKTLNTTPAPVAKDGAEEEPSGAPEEGEDYLRSKT